MEEKLMMVGLIAGAILASVLGYFIYSLMRQHKRVVQWQQARIQAEVVTLEAERKRIATNLHDEIGPRLSAIRLQLGLLEKNEDWEQQVIAKSTGQIDEVIQHFRDVSFELLPNTLIRYGIGAATDELIERLPQGQLAIQFQCEDIALRKEAEINLFRIIQEIIHNTIKHAHATSLHISLRNVPPDILLETTDDGVGFAADAASSSRNSIGLLSIQSRVEILQGKLTLTTAPGKGTTYLITIPSSQPSTP